MESRLKTDTAAPRGTLALLTAAGFMNAMQILMVAPIVPDIARDFGSTSAIVGLAVPAFLVPYGAMVLVWGKLSDRWGRRPVILTSLAAFTVLNAATPLVVNAPGFIGMRLATGLGAAGVVPIGVALIGDLVPYERRGRALGWMFGGLAGGAALGAAGGALSEPVLGWRGLFGAVSIMGLALFALGLRLIPDSPRAPSPRPASNAVTEFADLLRTSRARRTFSYVLVNAVLHFGILTWLGVYLHQHFQLNETRIGLALLGYGIPGLALGPVIGHLGDRYGRARIIPLGLTITAGCIVVLSTEPPLAIVQAAVIVFSLGYDMTQPLLAGIVTDLPGSRGQATGFNSCIQFVGMGIGGLAFQAPMLTWGFRVAFVSFAVLALLSAVAAVRLFRAERPSAAVTTLDVA